MEAALAVVLSLMMLPTALVTAFGPLVFCALVFRATALIALAPFSTERASPLFGLRLWFIVWSGSASLFFGCLELLRLLA